MAASLSFSFFAILRFSSRSLPAGRLGMVNARESFLWLHCGSSIAQLCFRWRKISARVGPQAVCELTYLAFVWAGDLQGASGPSSLLQLPVLWQPVAPPSRSRDASRAAHVVPLEHEAQQQQQQYNKISWGQTWSALGLHYTRARSRVGHPMSVVVGRTCHVG